MRTGPGLSVQHIGTLAAAVGAMLSVTTAVKAQQLEEILVTAERRETSLQETPISIATFSAETMELKGLETLEDVAAFTPNLDIKGGRTGGNISPTYQIRGLTGGGGAGGERSTAMYIDGVFMPRTTGPFLNVLDIERIEILRGPQGTLFGRNSTGGAIRVFTQQPGPERGGYVKLSAGDFNRADLSAMINLPISDKLFFRAQGGSLNQDGYVTRGTQELGGTEDVIGRVQLGFEPGDDLRVTFGLSSTDSESEGTPTDIATFDMAPDLNFQGNNADWVSDFLAAAGQPRLTLEDPRIVRDDYTMPDWCFIDDANPDWDVACEQRNNSTYRQFDVNVAWQINDVWSLSSITGLSDFRSAGLGDAIGLGTQSAPTNVESDVSYQELQLNAELAGGRLNLVTGLSYFQEDSTSYGFGQERRGTSTFFPQNPGTNGPAVGLNPNGTFRTGDARFTQDSQSYGVFANVTWNITDRLALTPGVRWAWDEKKVTDTSFVSNSFTPAPGTTSTTISTSNDWDDVDWRLTLDYDIKEDLMLYATASKAFRAGAYSYTIPSWTATNNATSQNLTAGLVQSPPFVAPESVENHEIGMRSEWFDGKLRINLTYFDMDYTNRQAATPVTVPITQAAAGFIIVTTNTGDVALDGFELEGQVAATENFTVDFSAGTLDYTLANVCANNGDFLFPGPADSSYSLGASYFKALRAGSELTFSLNYGWTDKQQTHPGGIIDPVSKGCAAGTGANFLDSRYELEDYGLLNGRVRYTSDDGQWALTLFGNNLTDEVYANYASRFGGGFWDSGNAAQPFAAPPRSALSLTRGRPREFGVTFQYNFGGDSAGSR
jgi:iron complex outermembrane receptor protein